MTRTRHINPLLLVVGTLTAAASPTCLASTPLKWTDWTSMPATGCGRVRFEFRMTSEPRNEYFQLRATNVSDTPLIAIARPFVLRTDGKEYRAANITFGTTPHGGYEGWIEPGHTTQFKIGKATPGAQPLVEAPIIGRAIALRDVFVLTRARYHEKVDPLPRSTYYTVSQIAERCADSGWVRSQADLNADLLEQAAEGHVREVTALLESGANPDAQELDGWSALMYASYFGHDQVAVALLAHGATVRLKGRENHTALMHAAARGHEAVVKLLIRSGADVSASTDFGYTALRFAEAQRQGACARLLRDAGASG